MRYLVIVRPSRIYSRVPEIISRRVPRSQLIKSYIYMDLLVCTSEIAVSEVYTESEPAGEEDVKMWKSEHYQQSELRRQQIFLHYNHE